MITIYQKTILDLIKIKNKIIEIKNNLENNQKLIITLDTETTGKYYNKFQIENTGIDIVDKIIEFGAIFSIQNIDYYGFETIVPIEDTIFNENPDLGFRIFFNPFIDNHKPFHITMPKEPFEIHGISLEFLEGKTMMEVSNEILFEPAPSLLNKYNCDEYESSYIKEIIEIINLCDILIAHNATFDVGMINEAVNDYNKLNEEKISYINCQIIDTLKLFKEEFPKELLIAMQEEKEAKEINHKLDNMMYLAGIEARDVHGAYWDSKLLIDSYSIILEKYLTKKFKKSIVIKQTEYLSKLNYEYNNQKILSFEKEVEKLFFEKLHNKGFLNINKIKSHLKLQLININKQKRNLITEEQIENSILYYQAFVELNKEIDSLKTFEEKIEKMTSKTFDKMIKDIKDSKILLKQELDELIRIDMSHYLSQAVFYYFKYKLEKEIILPLLEENFNVINNLIESKKDIKIELEEDYVYSYFRTDGSIATKDNSLTTIIGSVSNVKKYFEVCNMNKVICMDFNSMVNYINVGKYLKAYNESHENKIELNYGLTTLTKLYLTEEIKEKYNIELEFIDFETNIICKNDDGIRLIPQILKHIYSDKFENENSYKDPYLSLDKFKELNKNNNLCLTLGSYKGLIERILFDFDLNNKKELIEDLIDLFEEKINIEIYPSDAFLLEYKENFVNKVDYIFTNPTLYLEDDYEAHLIRCHKYNDNIYQLNNYRIFNNFEFNIINQ